jgi:hypothetical protein
VRAAAVDDFLRDLRARGAADLNGVMSTLNDGSLCREAQEYWIGQGWVVVSPSTPLHALAGPRFSRELSLRRFCGMPEEADEAIPAAPPEEAEESESDDDS